MTSPAPTEPSVRIENVVKKFGGVTALDNVSVDFEAGKINVLLGLSGSGKSTLMRHINGLHLPTSGSVNTLGTRVEKAKPAELRELRSRVGMIFQHFHLVDSMSVLENVCTGKLGAFRFPRIGTFMYSKDVRREAMAQLERVGLAEKAFQRADTLSGGQQQRVAIARALIQRPKLLLADEPVASLDPVSSAGVIDLLTAICRDEGITVVCSLHQFEVALAFGDRIIGLRSGKVVLDRPAEGLDATDAFSIYEAVSATPEEMALAGTQS